MRRDDDLPEDRPRFGAPIGEPETWTPSAVGKALVWALKIARYTAGATHPRSYGSGLPEVIYSAEEIKEMEARDLKRPPSPRQITLAEEALHWQGRYLADQPDLVAASMILKVWLRCRVHGRKFDDECDKRGWARATAYRRRDKALAVISVGLDLDGVQLWRP